MTPPHNPDSERYVLGASILDPKAYALASKTLSPDDFYMPRHRDVWVALESAPTVDILAVRDKLVDPGFPEDYLFSLIDLPTTAAIEYHVKVVSECARRRDIIRVCQATMHKAWDMSEDVDGIVSVVRSDIKALSAGDARDYRPASEVLNELIKDIEKRRESGNPFSGIRCGLVGIDTHLMGLEPCTTTYLIARPSVGKTALALNMAERIADQGHRVLFFALESGDKALTRRRLASKSGVYLSRIRSGDIDDSQWPDLIEAADKLSASPLIVIDKPKYKVVEHLVSCAEAIHFEHPLSCIFIDHIQRMRCRARTSSRHLEISAVSEELSSLAKELNIPIVILCQLRRPPNENNPKPRLEMMKESGDLEQNADNVIGLWRKDKESTNIEIYGLKGRDIGTWQDKLRFDRFTQSVTDFIGEW